jgi:Spy/CpxP family protein refolding chaperone
MSTATLTRWKIIAALGVVAASSGWVGFIAGERHRDREAAEQRRDRSGIHLLYLRRLEEALQLTPAQRDRIRPALDTAAARTRQLSTQTATEAARIREDMRAAITPLLTPEQRAGYEKFEADREARHERLRGNVRSYLDSKSNHRPDAAK